MASIGNGIGENMEDRYLFKAKRIDNGEWVTGSLITCEDGTYKIATSCLEGKANEPILVCAYDVDRDTICQCTGLKDKNGKLIWENDICNYYNPEDKDGIGIIKNGYVLWIDGTISMRHKMTPLFYLQCKDEWEVIGNVFDNPELLESEG